MNLTSGIYPPFAPIEDENGVVAFMPSTRSSSNSASSSSFCSVSFFFPPIMLNLLRNETPFFLGSRRLVSLRVTSGVCCRLGTPISGLVGVLFPPSVVLSDTPAFRIFNFWGTVPSVFVRLRIWWLRGSMVNGRGEVIGDFEGWAALPTCRVFHFALPSGQSSTSATDRVLAI